MEMFNTLDINKDGTFDSVDVENIKIDNVNRFLGRMKDRFADMEDILIDQKMDFHIAREPPMSRKSLVKQVSETTKTVKDEL